jgi:broad specificity phosphatase PhoE
METSENEPKRSAHNPATNQHAHIGETHRRLCERLRTRKPGDMETEKPGDMETRKPGDMETIEKPGDMETLEKPGDMETIEDSKTRRVVFLVEVAPLLQSRAVALHPVKGEERERGRVFRVYSGR